MCRGSAESQRVCRQPGLRTTRWFKMAGSQCPPCSVIFESWLWQISTHVYCVCMTRRKVERRAELHLCVRVVGGKAWSSQVFCEMVTAMDVVEGWALEKW